MAFRTSRQLALSLALAGSLLLLSGCSDGDEDATTQNTASTPTAPTPDDADGEDGDDLSEFCAEADRQPEVVPETFVGSAEHIAHIEALAAEAPDDIRPELETFRDFLTSGEVTDDPDSNLVENWPAEVAEAAEASREFIAANC